ncbi:hypothetical protein EGW08_010827 [Elysia chlorotica]|uniref:Uncharacterized protein n=1 Tax=Elysia chlorotica TaxID=188477 RepID=A0A3S0ZMR7_ELYCH|nr:hypothetical protein EGW08_010827 [Elysia chlorotica]
MYCHATAFFVFFFYNSKNCQNKSYHFRGVIFYIVEISVSCICKIPFALSLHSKNFRIFLPYLSISSLQRRACWILGKKFFDDVLTNRIFLKKGFQKTCYLA